MNPYRDPNSTKYPDRTFNGGRWRTPEQIEKRREIDLRYRQTEKGREARRRYSQTEKGLENRRRWKERCIDAGLCSNCGKRPLATASGRRCNECLEKWRERQRRYLETHFRLKVGGLALGTYRLPEGLSKEKFLKMAAQEREELKHGRNN